MEKKNIFLVGPSRAGKTTMATELSKQMGYTHIIMDAIIETMSDTFPELQIKHGNLESPQFIQFLQSYSKNLFKYGKNNIIDLEVLSPSIANQMLDKDESRDNLCWISFYKCRRKM